jgi:hypothetical protein
VAATAAAQAAGRVVEALREGDLQSAPVGAADVVPRAASGEGPHVQRLVAEERGGQR